MKGTPRKIVSNSLSLFSSSIHHHHAKSPSSTSRVFQGLTPFSTTTNKSTHFEKDSNPLLEKFRMRKLKGAETKTPIEKLDSKVEKSKKFREIKENPHLGSSSFEDLMWKKNIAETKPSNEMESEVEKLKKFEEMKENLQVGSSSFEDLGLSDEVMVAVKEMNIWGPTEIQCVGIPALLEGKNVVLGADVESGATFAYLLPIIQLLRRDEAALGIGKHGHPQAVVLCPDMELADEISNVTRTIMHYVSGGDGSMLQEQDVSFDVPIDLVAGTPSSLLHKIEKGEIAYDDIKYLVLEDADTIFESGFGSDMCKFLNPLKNLAAKSDGRGFQMVLVISSITKILSEHTSSVVQQLEQNNSGKVAGILLEMDQAELFELALSSDDLKRKVTEAMMSLT